MRYLKIRLRENIEMVNVGTVKYDIHLHIGSQGLGLLCIDANNMYRCIIPPWYRHPELPCAGALTNHNQNIWMICILIPLLLIHQLYLCLSDVWYVQGNYIRLLSVRVTRTFVAVVSVTQKWIRNIQIILAYDLAVIGQSVYTGVKCIWRLYTAIADVCAQYLRLYKAILAMCTSIFSARQEEINWHTSVTTYIMNKAILATFV